jgi:hypothetical protein
MGGEDEEECSRKFRDMKGEPLKDRTGTVMVVNEQKEMVGRVKGDEGRQM